MKVIGILLASVLSFVCVSIVLGFDEAVPEDLAGVVSSVHTSQQPGTADRDALASHRSAVPAEQALFLIRSALMALDNANRSGNYSVLRDLASPDFQRRNSPEALANIFAPLRQQHWDLAPAAISQPQVNSPLSPDDRGFLRLAGRIAITRPAITFNLGYLPVDGHWRLDEVGVAAVPPS